MAYLICKNCAFFVRVGEAVGKCRVLEKEKSDCAVIDKNTCKYKIQPYYYELIKDYNEAHKKNKEL